MSIATAVTSAIEEIQNATDDTILTRLAPLDDSTNRDTDHDHSDSEDSEDAIAPRDRRALTFHLLKEELEDKCITLPER